METLDYYIYMDGRLLFLFDVVITLNQSKIRYLFGRIELTSKTLDNERLKKCYISTMTNDQDTNIWHFSLPKLLVSIFDTRLDLDS